MYRSRDAEHTVLHPVVAEHVEAFLGAVAEAGDGASLPQFVEREFREFLLCGVFEGGSAVTDCVYPSRYAGARAGHAPASPLRGSELEVLSQQGKTLLVVRLPDGSALRMPRAWTDADGGDVPDELVGTCVYTPESLRGLIRLVDALRARPP